MESNRTRGETGTTGRERAIVTGAPSGIGRAVAVRLARRGTIVSIVGRNEAAARAAADEVQKAGGVAFINVFDVADPAQVEAGVERFVKSHGGVETVVSAAGIAVTGTATTTSLADWKRVMDTNLNGSFYLARFTIPELIKTRGTFTAISSDAGVQAACGYAAYTTSKHGLQGFVKCLALDYGRLGVRSNAVCPAFVETPMADQLLKDVTPE